MVTAEWAANWSSELKWNMLFSEGTGQFGTSQKQFLRKRNNNETYQKTLRRLTDVKMNGSITAPVHASVLPPSTAVLLKTMGSV